MDVLGQQHLLARAHGPYADREQMQAAFTAVTEAIQPVFWLRLAAAGLKLEYERFQRSFVEKHPEYTVSQLRTQSFGDTLVVFAQLHQPGTTRHLAMPAVHAGLMCTSLLFLQGLAKSYPLRGGLDIEVGANISDNEVYGQALCAAYRLESVTADSLRVAVGSGLVSVIDSARTLPMEGDHVHERDLAKEASEFIVRDDDGAPILDYLGPKMKERAETLRLPLQSEARKARDFLDSQRTRWSAAGELSRARKYSAAIRYFKSRGF